MARTPKTVSRPHNPVLDKIREMAGLMSDRILVNRVPIPSRYPHDIYEFSLFAGDHKVALMSLPISNKSRLRQILREIEAHLAANQPAASAGAGDRARSAAETSARRRPARRGGSSARPVPASPP